jgi:N-acylneuraminate cytidylyltransferase
MRNLPPKLKPGDKIAIAASARKITIDELKPAIAIFERWGLEVVLHPELFAEQNQFAGSDEIRARVLNSYLQNTDIKAVIFARGGSKGIKNKNIRVIGGKPLIAHAIECALASKYIKQVIVSTDSDEIAKVATEYGAKILKRPSELASDTAPENLSWQHAIESNPNLYFDKKNSLFISLPATSPLRAPIDVDNAIERFMKRNCDVVFGISPSQRNPYLNMVTIGKDDDLINIAIAGSKAVRRQDVPDVFDITTCVYVTSPEYVMTCGRLMDGRVGYVKIPTARAIDIDEEYDLYLADLMLTHPFPGKNEEYL